MSNALWREALAEFFGTFILIVFGVGVVAQVVLSKGAAGNFLSINIAWGLAVTMGCYVCAGVTGAHLNPAVTLALAVHRRFPWNKVLPYSLAQLAGASAAAGLAPVVVGLLVVLIGATFGFNSGYAINPARDFGPRLFTSVAGWGGEVFRAGNGWWWVPIVAPCVGGALGGWVYDLFVGSRFPKGD